MAASAVSLPAADQLTSALVILIYLYVFAASLSLLANLRHAAVSTGARQSAKSRWLLTSRFILTPAPLTPGTNWGVGQRICRRRTVDSVLAWLARGTVAEQTAQLV